MESKRIIYWRIKRRSQRRIVFNKINVLILYYSLYLFKDYFDSKGKYYIDNLKQRSFGANLYYADKNNYFKQNSINYKKGGLVKVKSNWTTIPVKNWSWPVPLSHFPSEITLDVISSVQLSILTDIGYLDALIESSNPYNLTLLTTLIHSLQNLQDAF